MVVQYNVTVKIQNSKFYIMGKVIFEMWVLRESCSFLNDCGQQ